MRINRWMLRCVALVVLMAACIAPACGSSGRASLIRYVPKEDTAEVKSVDVKAFREDSDLADAYESWKQSYEGRLDQVGVDPDSVDSSAGFEDTLMLTGRFDVGKLQSSLENNGYVRGQLDPDTVIWTGGHLGCAYVDERTVIIGLRVTHCIRVMRRDMDPLENAGDVSDVVHRLSSGLILGVLNWPLHFGMKAAAYTVEKTRKDTCHVTIVYKFDSEVSPEYSADAVENHEIRMVALKNVDIKQDGQYITLTGDVKTHDLFVPFGMCDLVAGTK